MRRQVGPNAEPHEVWNAFVDLLATEDYESLEPTQRLAHLVFWYDAEVQNGGHGQYFDTFGFGRVPEVIAALGVLGLPCQAEVLRRAASSWSEAGVADAAYVDAAYHRCAPSVMEALERCLAEHRDAFIAFERAG